MKSPDPHTQPNRGRPPLPKEEARSERIATFLTPSQRLRLAKLANATGQTLSSVAHALIVQGLEQEENTENKGYTNI